MATATKPKRRTSTPRTLREWSASAPAGTPLRIDRERRVIEGVRVLGRFSRNSHGLKEAVNGTEYTPECMRGAIPLYEGAEVLADHDTAGGRTAGLAQRRTERGVEYVVGVLRNVRMEGEAGKEHVRADLHYFDSHPVTARVLEDVERGLGVFGLSHDASAGRERFDPQAKRLVIESLSAVRSVDLVRKPATNRNLWESREMKTTLRELLEARRPKWSKARRLWATRLLEDDMMAPSMDAPMDAPAAGGDEDDALWTGFKQAIDKLFDQYVAGEMDEKAVGKTVVEYLKAHKKLTSDTEPAAPDVQEEEDDDADKKSDAAKTESLKAENDKLKRKIAVRELIEEAKIPADKAFIESLEELPIASARKLVEREKARGGGSPRSSGAPNGGAKKGDGKPRGEKFLEAVTE